jgi:hypothetical protein
VAILVGDPIVTMRAAGPDPCGVLPPPVQPTIAQVAGGSLTGPLYVTTTWQTPWGETSASPEQSLASFSAGNASASITQTIPAGATKARVYYGNVSGQEAQYIEANLLALNLNPGQNVTITISGAGSPGVPPTRNRAYIPDADGKFIDAATAFRWLNMALKQMVVTLGGIPDISGVAWPSQAAWAVLNNRWTEIQNAWWQGWWQVFGKQEYTWLQSPVESTPSYTNAWSSAGRDIVGLWPQPGSGPPSSTLALPMGINDQFITLVPGGAGLFTCPGLVQVDDEFMLVSTPDVSNTILQGALRGIGGTVATTHSAGATCTQLIFMFAGNRLAPEFCPGMSYAMLQLPAGWDVPLDTFMLAKYREKEQLAQESQQKMVEFKAMIEDLRSSRDPVPKGRAIGDGRVFNAFLGYRNIPPIGVIWK